LDCIDGVVNFRKHIPSPVFKADIVYDGIKKQCLNESDMQPHEIEWLEITLGKFKVKFD